jgi:hypothetical protein
VIFHGSFGAYREDSQTTAAPSRGRSGIGNFAVCATTFLVVHRGDTTWRRR